MVIKYNEKVTMAVGSGNGVWVWSGSCKFKEINNPNKIRALFEPIMLCAMKSKVWLTRSLSTFYK